jgi:molecular chaperone GrpE
MSEKPNKEQEAPKEELVEVEYITERKKSPKEPGQKSEQTKTLKSRLKKKETEIKDLKKKFQEMQEEFLRKAAEMENLRKRLEREKGDYFEYALSEHLKELLGVLDNFERAIESQNIKLFLPKNPTR